MNRIDTVIVSGAGDGLGKALAIECSKYYQVICISKSDNVFDTLEIVRKNNPNSVALKADISNLQNTKKLLNDIDLEKKFCGFLLCAGQLGQKGGLADTDLSKWISTFQTNVIGNLNIVQSLMNNLKSNKFAKIFFFAGGGSAYGFPIFSSYSLSKTAIVRAAENLHLECEKYGDITSLAIAPGAIKTKMLDKVMEAGAEVKTTVPIQETVNFIIKLLSIDTKHLSGRFIHVRDEIDTFLPSDTKDSKWMLRRNE